LSFRQAASGAIDEDIVRLIQLVASLPRDSLDTIADIDPLTDQITEGEPSKILRQNAEALARP
jgi:hypothetical protein